MLEGTYTKKSKKVKDGEPEKGENEKPEESKVVNNEKNKRALRRTESLAIFLEEKQQILEECIDRIEAAHTQGQPATGEADDPIELDPESEEPTSPLEQKPTHQSLEKPSTLYFRNYTPPQSQPSYVQGLTQEAEPNIPMPSLEPSQKYISPYAPVFSQSFMNLHTTNNDSTKTTIPGLLTQQPRQYISPYAPVSSQPLFNIKNPDNTSTQMTISSKLAPHIQPFTSYGYTPPYSSLSSQSHNNTIFAPATKSDTFRLSSEHPGVYITDCSFCGEEGHPSSSCYNFCDVCGSMGKYGHFRGWGCSGS